MRISTIVVIILIIAGSVSLYYLTISPEAPASPYVTEYLPTQSTSYPNAITVDSSGRVWFALQNETSIGLLYPSNGTVKTFSLPESKKLGLETWGIAADSANGLVYFTDHITNSIWSFNMTSSKFTQFPIPTSGSFPFQVALDNNGDVWFTESFAGKLGELTPQGMIKEYRVPGNSSLNQDPSGLAIANGSELWFTEPDLNMIGSFIHGRFTMYNTTGSIYSPVGITVDSKGNIWVTQHTYPGLVSEFNPSTHSVKSFSTSYSQVFGSSLPYFIYTDSNGRIWFNEHYGNSIAVYDPETSYLVEYYVPLRRPVEGNLSYILTMALSPSGRPWFTELFTGKIGTVNTSIPVEQNLSVTGISSQTRVFSGTNLTVPLTVRGGGTLSAYVGNFTHGLSFTFSSKSGTGNYSSSLLIQNHGASPGIYFITVSDATSFVTVSQVIEVQVPQEG